jgi:hypothetical protein
MPSTSKPQATLMAMAAHNPAFAKKKGVPVGVARDFNRADQHSGILKKAGGGPATMFGHGLSGTQLGEADNLIRKAQDRFATFAEGGVVKKPAGPSAQERKEIRGLIERGKSDAVSALRDTRDALIDAQPSTDETLQRLSQQLAMKDGGAVSGGPESLYQEYLSLMQELDDAEDSEKVEQTIDRLAQIEDELGALGIDVGGGEPPA